MERIEYLESILASETKLMGVVRDELIEVRERYGDERRTQIVDALGELTMHDLVAEEDQVVTLSRLGYIKRCSPGEWRMQHRGGVGKRGMNTRAEDFVVSLFIANTHSILLVFTESGKVYPLNVYEVPEAGRTARGRPIVNLVPVGDDRIAAVVSVREISDEEEGNAPDLMFVSRNGLIKRTPLWAYKNLRSGGMNACGVAEEDALVVVRKIEKGDGDVMLLTRGGKCIRFHLDEVPQFGRTARGNKGIKLSKTDVVVDAVILPPAAGDDEQDEDFTEDEVEVEEATDLDEDHDEETLLTVTELGYGKRTRYDHYRRQRRHGKGILSFKASDRTGLVVGAAKVISEDQLMLVTDTGRVIRIGAGSVSLYGRVTQGVRLMRLDAGERIVDLARIEDPEEADELESADAEEAENTENIEIADQEEEPSEQE
jgi:DNA gyrase subunit A